MTTTPKPTTRIYVLPVSGNLFPVQLGILSAISMANTIIARDRIGREPSPAPTLVPPDQPIDRRHDVPDIVLASSGGNIASYMALAANWDRDRIRSMTDLVSSDAFLASWYDTIPSWILLPFSRSLYRPGYGFETLFQSMFTTGQLRFSRTEIWTGVFNRTTSLHRVFSNRALGESILFPGSATTVTDQGTIAPSVKSINLGFDYSPIYAAGDQTLLAKVALASASIPWLVQPVRINGEEYSDAGSSAASPLVMMEHPILRLATDRNHILRLIYISPVPFSLIHTASTSLFGDIPNLLTAISNNDVRTFIRLILQLGADPNTPPDVYKSLTPELLAELLASLDRSGKHYAILLHPEQENGGMLDLLTGSSSYGGGGGGGGTSLDHRRVIRNTYTTSSSSSSSSSTAVTTDFDPVYPIVKSTVELTNIKPAEVRTVIRTIEQSICGFVWRVR